MSIAYAMTAKHLGIINQNFDNGIPYHYTDPKKVDEIKALVKKTATQLDYSLPTCGTAHLRLNTIIKEFPNKESWQYGGGVLTSEDVDAQIAMACERAMASKPGKVLKDTSLACYILNEFERYVVVFDLVITVGVE